MIFKDWKTACSGEYPAAGRMSEIQVRKFWKRVFVVINVAGGVWPILPGYCGGKGAHRWEDFFTKHQGFTYSDGLIFTDRMVRDFTKVIMLVVSRENLIMLRIADGAEARAVTDH